MQKNLFYFILALLPIIGFGQILQEGFEDVETLEANGWTMTNLSQPVGSTNWFQGNPAVFSSHQGASTSYIGANFNNTNTVSGIISNWLITPTVNVKDGDVLSFWTRTSEGSLWNDRLEVRSSQGAMTLPTGVDGVGSFTNFHLVINDDLDLSYPEVWTKYEITVSGVGSTEVPMNFAFRYNLDNDNGNESNFIGIDTVLIEGEGGDPDPGDDCDPVNVPYLQDFESASVPAMPDCTTIENAGSGNNWETSDTAIGEFTGKYLSYKYHANDANAWFYTQGINLTAGTQYKITYEYGSRAAAAYPENLKVAFGMDNSHTAMTEVLADHIGILTGSNKITSEIEFTPATSGVYYFGFNAHSSADQFYLYVDNISIDLVEGTDPQDPVPGEPDFDCFQGDGLTSSFDDAFNIRGSGTYRTADDFIVEEGIEFTLRQITVDVNQQEIPDNAIIKIREDMDGAPGEVLDVITMAPTSSLEYAEAFGDPIYHLTFDLATPLVYTEGTYWLDVSMTTPSNEIVWWLATTTGSHGAWPHTSTDGGETWTEYNDGLQLVFFVAGDCEEVELGVNDMNSFDFAYYPNPVNDVLNITSQKEVKSIEAFNLTGQKVLSNTKALNGQINVSALSAGTYVFKVTLENGQVETFKVIKK